jgi:peptide/nickel transport system ATP-binding protein
MTETVFEADGLSVVLRRAAGSVTAVRRASLSIQPSETVALVGESGAGKSLFCYALIGLLPAVATISEGRLMFQQQRIDDLPESARRKLHGKSIGMVFQDAAASLNPMVTIGSQIVETLELNLGLSRSDARHRAAEVLAGVGIAGGEGRLGFYPHQLSGGQQKRVTLALALCSQPKLLIADEPTAGLDAPVRAEVLRFLKAACWQQGAGLLLVTHDMIVARAMADRVAVMYAGEIVESGPAREVLEHPHHPYSAALLACVPKLGGRAARLPQIDGLMPRPGDLPAGCSFAPRCPQRMENCERERPGLVTIGKVRVACWLHEEASDG